MRFLAFVPRNVAMRSIAWLTAKARYDESDRLSERCLRFWPTRPRLLYLYAMNAHVRGQFETAERRWEALRSVDPDWPMAWAGIVANRRILNETQTAEPVIREALARFPDDIVVANEAARLFARIGSFEEANVQWRRLIDLDDVNDEWLQGYAYSLIHAGRFAEAEATLDRADKAYPGDRDLLSTRAVLEMEREDWNAALALWRRYRARYPDDQAGWEGQGKTIAAIHAARADDPETIVDAVKIDVGLVEDESRRTLLLGFESLGADCEFGLVQRRHGAEPLGLLRFNDVRLPDLMKALETEFAGMGDPAHTAMVVREGGEFYVTDTRWGLGMHTFMFKSRFDAEELLPKMCRRVAYLRDKLVADLRAAEKTFVFKSDAVDMDGLLALHDALSRFGDVRLLHVRRASVPLADWPLAVRPGRVILVKPRLYVGFLSRMGYARHRWDILFEEWLAICGGLDAASPLSGCPPVSGVEGVGP